MSRGERNIKRGKGRNLLLLLFFLIIKIIFIGGREIKKTSGNTQETHDATQAE